MLSEQEMIKIFTSYLNSWVRLINNNVNYITMVTDSLIRYGSSCCNQREDTSSYSHAVYYDSIVSCCQVYSFW